MMKTTTKILFTLLCIMFMATLTGCTGYQNMEGSQVTDYLSDRYGGEFEILSVEEKARCDRNYLDVDMEKLNSKSDDAREDKDYIYTIKDENGVEFHLVGFKQYGWGSFYRYTDDYNTQILKMQNILYEKLDRIGFPYTYYNGIGYDDVPKTTFNIQISRFEDVAGAVTDICEMVACEQLEIPWMPYSGEEFAVTSIIPSVRLLVQDICVWEIKFHYASQEAVEDVETCIKNAEREYVYCVREGIIDEELSEDVLLIYGPEKIKEVYYQGEKVPIYLYYGINPSLETNWDGYIVWDNPEKCEESEARVCYEDLEQLLTTVGYQTDYTENAVVWRKGGNVVTIKVDDDDYICELNGKTYVTEGIVNATLIKLTEKDMQELFGISYEINKIEETAQIVCE